MTWTLLALAAGVVAFLVQEVRLRAAMGKLEDARRSVSDLSMDLTLVNRLVSELRQEARHHLEIIRSCDDPRAVRELSERLLHDPWFTGPAPTPRDPGVEARDADSV